MNANLNMTSKYNARTYQSSSDIRRAYLASSRKVELEKLFSVSPAFAKNLVFALKAILALACAIAFFSVIGLIESGEITFFTGFIYTALISLAECLCFITFKSKNNVEGK